MVAVSRDVQGHELPRRLGGVWRNASNCVAVVRPGRWASGHRCELVIMPSAAGPAVSVRSRTTLMPYLTTTAAGSSIASASRPGIAACRTALRSRFARARMPVSYPAPSLMALMRGVAGRRQSYARRRRARRCQVLVCAFLGHRRRSCSLVPPHTPWSCLVSSAKARHCRRTGQPAQIALACVI